jgi:hypothetical protein
MLRPVHSGLPVARVGRGNTLAHQPAVFFPRDSKRDPIDPESGRYNPIDAAVLIGSDSPLEGNGFELPVAGREAVNREATISVMIAWCSAAKPAVTKFELRSVGEPWQSHA